MDIRTQKLMEFLDSAHSVYHGVAALVKVLEEAGYTRLEEAEGWQLVPGGKYYLTRGGSAITAFRVPHAQPKGFMISACHADRPSFKVKENGELVSAYTRLETERYGGMLIFSWLDRPLSVAGRVLVETEKGVESRLVDIDRDLLLIPNVAIHMNRKVNEGVNWNPAVDSLPLLGSKEAAGSFWPMIREAAGGEILGHDLYLYIRHKASVWGLEEQFISSAALDDLACVWTCTQGFLQAGESESVPVICAFDSEEVGSGSLQGAASDFLASTLSRISKALSLSEKQMLAQSFLVSADNAHAIHPNHPEYADPNNAPVINEGLVLKFNAAQRYITDGVSAAVFRKVCRKAGVPVQSFYNRPDIPGGSTLGHISLSQVGVPSVDVGIAQLAMHSCYETAGVKDAIYMEEAMRVFYETTLEHAADGSYILR
ncbi:MAG: M18 family aminopeptidase [Oscillospiraceae bacterium]|nr:M18 family aminopeptidase [Oscillospiraceae bacterium]